MIEISDKKYWKNLSWWDAKLYCSLLTIDGKEDWRMWANHEEWETNRNRIIDGKHLYYAQWFANAEDRLSNYSLRYQIVLVIPVRDY